MSQTSLDLRDADSCPRDAPPHTEDADSCPGDAASCTRDVNSYSRDAQPHSHGLERGGITTMVMGICCGTGERLPKPIPAGIWLLQPPEAKKFSCLQATNSQVIPSPMALLLSLVILLHNGPSGAENGEFSLHPLLLHPQFHQSPFRVLGG